MTTQYNFVERMNELYARLQDERSKEIFWARLRCDVEPTWKNSVQLAKASGNFSEKLLEKIKNYWTTIRCLSDGGHTVILYGAGCGGMDAASDLQNNSISFTAFCDKNKAGGGGGKYLEKQLSLPMNCWSEQIIPMW